MNKPIVNFEKQMNDIVAPVTRAWTNYSIEQVSVKGIDIGEDEARFAIVVTAKRRTERGDLAELQGRARAIVKQFEQALKDDPNLKDAGCPYTEFDVLEHVLMEALEA